MGTHKIEYTQEQLVEIVAGAQAGDQTDCQILFEKFEGYAHYLTRRFFLPGAEKEDLFQEAVAGFAKALDGYSAQHGTRVEDYFCMCMRNSVVASVRKATRKKQQVLSDATALDDVVPVASSTWSPERVVEGKMAFEQMLRGLKEALSSLEFEALFARIRGITVGEIGEAMGISPKTVENALFRARHKARKVAIAMA